LRSDRREEGTILGEEETLDGARHGEVRSRGTSLDIKYLDLVIRSTCGDEVTIGVELDGQQSW
jgi:hypothetical protein